MIENPDFRYESILSVRLNRRKFLKLAAAAAGGVMLQAACSPLGGCPLSQRLETPSSYINDLKEAIAPLTRLMPHATVENLTIKVAKGTDGTSSCAFSIKSEIGNIFQIRILLQDASPETLEYGKTGAFHEAAHIFDFSNNLLPSKYYEQEMKKRAGRSKYTANEYQILKESSYCNISACRNAGHPESKFREVFASSITILRFYPFEFIEKLEELSNPESKRLLATNAMVCIDALKKFSAIPVEYSDLPFDPNLVTYLMQESQNSVS